MASVGALHSLRSFQRRLPWALGILMRIALTVNEAIDGLASLAGQDVAINGLLRWEFEHYAIDHLPTSERREHSSDGCSNSSSIWLEVGGGALQFNEPVLEKWNGKRVVVEGTLYAPVAEMGGCGHFSGWPALLVARTIERDKASRYE
jgi:hypothetical protein